MPTTATEHREKCEWNEIVNTRSTHTTYRHTDTRTHSQQSSEAVHFSNVYFLLHNLFILFFGVSHLSFCCETILRFIFLPCATRHHSHSTLIHTHRARYVCGCTICTHLHSIKIVHIYAMQCSVSVPDYAAHSKHIQRDSLAHKHTLVLRSISGTSTPHPKCGTTQIVLLLADYAQIKFK